MEVYHLSHIDLDGYSCQIVSREFFRKIYFYNANYGLEVMSQLRKILEEVMESEAKKVMILVTDVNLTESEADYLDSQVKEINGKKDRVVLQLLDHHKTGEASAKKHDWYYLDESRCATRITFDFMMENYKIIKKRSLERLKPLVEVVNAADLWKEEESGFEFGKVLMRSISETREISRYMFPNESRDYRFYVVLRSLRYINKPKGHIKFDDALHKVKKKFLAKSKRTDTLENLRTEYYLHILDRELERFTIQYRGHKGCLSFSIGSISSVANEFLHHHPEYHFFMEVGMKGNCSFRADNQMDVSAMAVELMGGGGHPNASGGRINGFKETFSYAEVKSAVENLIYEKAVFHG